MTNCDRCGQNSSRRHMLECLECGGMTCTDCLPEHQQEKHASSFTLREFETELAAWRRKHPQASEQQQMAVYSPHVLWQRAGGRSVSGMQVQAADAELYRKLMVAAGYIQPARTAR